MRRCFAGLCARKESVAPRHAAGLRWRGDAVKRRCRPQTVHTNRKVSDIGLESLRHGCSPKRVILFVSCSPGFRSLAGPESLYTGRRPRLIGYEAGAAG